MVSTPDVDRVVPCPDCNRTSASNSRSTRTSGERRPCSQSYVDVLEGGIVLTTSNGARDTNRIVLTGTVLDALVVYIVYIDRWTSNRVRADEQPSLRLELAEEDE
jgi:hypothetical protein